MADGTTAWVYRHDPRPRRDEFLNSAIGDVSNPGPCLRTGARAKVGNCGIPKLLNQQFFGCVGLCPTSDAPGRYRCNAQLLVGLLNYKIV